MRETLREKISKWKKIGRLSKKEKVAYGMLAVSVALAVIVDIVFGVTGMCAALEGSMLILLIAIIGLVFFPVLIVGGLQAILGIVVITECVKGRWKAAREFGVLCALFGIVLYGGVGVYGCISEELMLMMIVVAIVGVIYHVIVILLLGISIGMCKKGANKKYKAVLFDFDYTLGDSTDGIAKSIAYALEQLGEQPQELENIRKTIGMTLKEAYRTLTGNMDEERAVRFETYFKQKADEVMVDGTNLYEPTRQVVESLREQGCKIGIVTTKYHYRIDAILAKFGMSHMVDVIVGGDDVKKQKPAPDGLIYAMKLLGIADEEMLYIGDTVIDAKAAKSAGVDFVAVLTGTTEEIGFATYPKKAVANDLYGVMNFLRDENKL